MPQDVSIMSAMINRYTYDESASNKAAKALYANGFRMNETAPVTELRSELLALTQRVARIEGWIGK